MFCAQLLTWITINRAELKDNQNKIIKMQLILLIVLFALAQCGSSYSITSSKFHSVRIPLKVQLFNTPDNPPVEVKTVSFDTTSDATGDSIKSSSSGVTEKKKDGFDFANLFTYAIFGYLGYLLIDIVRILMFAVANPQPPVTP